MSLKRRLIFPIIFILIKSCTSSRGSAYDPFITCPGPPLTHATGLPLAYSETTYSTSLALCSVVHGAPQNVGCGCTSSGGPLRCNERVADSTLFNADVDDSGRTIADYCVSVACYCGDGNEVRIHNATSSSQVPTPTSSAPARVTNPGYDPNGPNPFRDTVNSAVNPGYDPNEPNPFRDAPNTPTTTGQCGIGCTTDEDCESCATTQTAAEQYKCRAAQRSTFNPSTGAAKFFSMCLIAASISGSMDKGSGFGGKRDVALPCPCNSTYVSHGCCGAKSGMVWEPEEFNLGELIDRDAL